MRLGTNERPAEVLLIEDNRGDTDLVRESLRLCTIPVRLTVVEHGEQAVLYLNRGNGYANAPRPDLILLDLNLPKKDGRDVLTQVKSTPSLSSIPIVVLTSSSALEDVNRTYDLRANCYLTKPFLLDDYIRLIQSTIYYWFRVVTLPTAEATASP